MNFNLTGMIEQDLSMTTFLMQLMDHQFACMDFLNINLSKIQNQNFTFCDVNFNKTNKK